MKSEESQNKLALVLNNYNLKSNYLNELTEKLIGSQNILHKLN